MNELQNYQQNSMAEAAKGGNLPYLPEDKILSPSCQTFPITELTSLGMASLQPMTDAIQRFFQKEGGSGLYYVNTKGKTMMKFKDGSGCMGGLAAENGGVGGGQAIINKVPIDPATIAMAATLTHIELKLDTIQELQQEMMGFLQDKERAKIRGNINILVDMMNNYKYNWDNDTYKVNKHILVQDIRRESEESIQLYRQQIGRLLGKKGFINSDQDVNAKLKKAQQLFRDYQLAMYQFSFASFLEVMLLENYDREYLSSTKQRIESLNLEYRELYTNVYDFIEGMSKGSIQTTLIKGLSLASQKTGSAIAKIPLVNKGPVDEALIAAGKKAERLNEGKADRTLHALVDAAYNCTTPFVESINHLQTMYNQPMGIAFDRDNIYLFPSDEGE